MADPALNIVWIGQLFPFRLLEAVPAGFRRPVAVYDRTCWLTLGWIDGYRLRDDRPSALSPAKGLDARRGLSP